MKLDGAISNDVTGGSVQYYFRFIVSGAVTAVVGLSVLLFLTEVFKIQYLVSSVFAHLCTIIVNFVLQKWWTFLDREHRRLVRQASLFVLVSLINLPLNVILMYLLVDLAQIWYFTSQAVVMCVLAVLNYTVYRSIIFNPRAQKEARPASTEDK